MVTIQRVRVRWGAGSRRAPAANARRGLCQPVVLPAALPVGDVVIHDVLVDEAVGYVPRAALVSGGLDQARDVDLVFSRKGSAVVVDRVPGHAAFPSQSGPARLFTLGPGEIGRYRANCRFTFTTCPCNPSWYYEDWLILIAHADLREDDFIAREPHHYADHRVHLYGGSRRSKQMIAGDVR